MLIACQCLNIQCKLSVSINYMYMYYVFQQIAPDSDRFENTKEQERQQWLKDLGKYLVGIVHVKGGTNLFLRSMINKLSLHYILQLRWNRQKYYLWSV